MHHGYIYQLGSEINRCQLCICGCLLLSCPMSINFYMHSVWFCKLVLLECVENYCIKKKARWQLKQTRMKLEWSAWLLSIVLFSFVESLSFHKCRVGNSIYFCVKRAVNACVAGSNWELSCHAHVPRSNSTLPPHQPYLFPKSPIEKVIFLIKNFHVLILTLIGF